METAYAKVLKAAPPDSDVQRTWLDALIHATETPAGLTQLNLIFQGKEKMAGLELDQDRRWATLQQMCKFNFPNMNTIVSEEEKRDVSSRAK